MSVMRAFDPETTVLEGLMLLEASAGTGKTYALERMVARLVGREENPMSIEEILVVTFTNRAAREMRERIRELLSQRARDSERDAGERDRCLRALAGFDHAPIYTIHGFCRWCWPPGPLKAPPPSVRNLNPAVCSKPPKPGHGWPA